MPGGHWPGFIVGYNVGTDLTESMDPAVGLEWIEPLLSDLVANKTRSLNFGIFIVGRDAVPHDVVIFVIIFNPSVGMTHFVSCSLLFLKP